MRATQIKLAEDHPLPGLDTVLTGYQMIARSYDPHMGGFSNMPKFPQPGMMHQWGTYICMSHLTVTASN